MAVETLSTISPSTNQTVVERKGLTDLQLDELSDRAFKAFLSFRKTTLKDRQDIVQKFLTLLRERQDELAQELTEQMGRPIAYGAKEVQTAAARGDYLLKVSEEVLRDAEGEAEEGFHRYIKKVPIGPVLVLFAWNYPWLILVNSLIPAILAGNTVILKPSPQTPTTAEQAEKLFVAAGLPKDVIQFFHCGSLAGIERVVRSPHISLVCFTGSVQNGLDVQKLCSDKVSVKVGLELGGKDPAYVRSDVDIKWAAGEIVDGAIFNSGQSCCSIERVYVNEKIHDQLVAAIQDELKGYTLGDPFDPKTQIGPVISKKAAATIESHIADAIQNGAHDATPENTSFRSPPGGGNYVAPRLLVNVTHKDKVMKEETFGPVIPVMSVKDDQQAISLMNDSQFGLTASIWTRDVKLGNALADEVEAGTVFVNRCDFPSPDLAWTGFKDSGKGQTLSKFGFDQFVKLKSYHIKDYPK